MVLTSLSDPSLSPKRLNPAEKAKGGKQGISCLIGQLWEPPFDCVVSRALASLPEPQHCPDAPVTGYCGCSTCAEPAICFALLCLAGAVALVQ